MDRVLRVLVVDDDPFTRAMVAGVLGGAGHEVVGEFGAATESMAIARSTAVDVAVLDLDLGEGPTGMDLAHGLRRLHPSIGIVLLSTYPEPRLLGVNLPAMPDGARYVVKQSISQPSQLVAEVESAAGFDSIASKRVAGDPRAIGLSDSQVEVMRLVAAGCSNAEIARRISIEEASVEKAIARLIKQLGVKADRQQNQRVMIAQAYHEMTGARSVRRA